MDNGDKRGVGREQREGRRIHFFMDSNSGICNIKNHSQGVVSFNGVPEGIGSCCRRRVVVRLCLTGILPSASPSSRTHFLMCSNPGVCNIKKTLAKGVFF